MLCLKRKTSSCNEKNIYIHKKNQTELLKIYFFLKFSVLTGMAMCQGKALGGWVSNVTYFTVLNCRTLLIYPPSCN